jgi:hypothetical protein
MKRDGRPCSEFDSGSGRIFLKFVECVSQDEKWDVCRVIAKALLQKLRCERIFGVQFFCGEKLLAGRINTDGKLSKVYYMRKSKKKQNNSKQFEKYGDFSRPT